MGVGDNKLIVGGKTCFVHIEQVYISEIGKENCNVTDYSFHMVIHWYKVIVQYRSLAYQNM